LNVVSLQWGVVRCCRYLVSCWEEVMGIRLEAALEPQLTSLYYSLSTTLIVSGPMR
jgi:hypothetical protein